MTLDEKVGQLLVVPICPTHGEAHLQNVRNLLSANHIGNAIMMAGAEAVQRDLIQSLQNERDTPLFIFQDVEWGIGMRLYDVPSLPKNLTLGSIQDLSLLKAFGFELARQCRSVGVEGAFAPVVDINSNPLNPVIHQRSFGDSPQEVTKRALAVMEGMQEGGLLACAKHFPGHGDTAVDSHHALPCIDKTLDQIRQLELIPFKALIDAGVEMVMVGHLYFPALSSEPSSLSPEIMTDLLRNELKFEKVIVSDALNMKALLGKPEENAVKALLAGCDLLVYATADPKESATLIETVIPAVIAQIKKEVPEALIDEKVARILQMKQKKLSKMPPAHPQLIRILYRQAITKIGIFPPLRGQVALVQNSPDPEFEAYLSRYAELAIFTFDEIEQASQYSQLIVSVRKNDPIRALPSHAIVALFDSPYRLLMLAHPRVLVGHEDKPEVKEAISDVLFGQLPPLGKLPIQL